MDKKTQGAWIIHHTHKLQGVTLATPDYEQIGFAGKCGIVLNALAKSEESQISEKRLLALARANGISVRLELSAILGELIRQRLIEKGKTGISVLGLTTTQTLEHTCKIFEEASPGDSERAAIEVSEKASHFPLTKKEAAEYISDTIHTSEKETQDILSQCENIGFFDSENLFSQKIYFNGNLFRREDIAKVKAVISSLSSDEERKVIELSTKLKNSGCLPKEDALYVLGDSLYSRLCAIGFIDENAIGNETGTFSFVTRPAAFSKFTNSMVDDAFDLAKALVTSLTYGMTTSPDSRGRIRMIEALMNKLIAGLWVGPATAIGQDYKVLEIKGVVEVRPSGGGRFLMRLLKKEVGRLALAVITEGEASTMSLLEVPSVSATKYLGPEANRTVLRKHQAEPLKRSVAKLLGDLRTGGLR